MSNTGELAQGRRGRTNPHPKMVWPPNQRGDLRIHLCWQEESAQGMFYSARGTEPLWGQGHETFIVLGAQDFLRVARGTSKS